MVPAGSCRSASLGVSLLPGMEYDLGRLVRGGQFKRLLDLRQRECMADQIPDHRRPLDDLHDPGEERQVIVPGAAHGEPLLGQVGTHANGQVLLALADKGHLAAPACRIGAKALGGRHPRAVERGVDAQPSREIGHLLQVRSVRRVDDRFGAQCARLLDAIQTHLPWDERQAVSRSIFRETRWAPHFAESREVSKPDRLKLLASTFLFHRFDEDELAIIASIVGSRAHGAGEAIITQDEEGDEAYVIRRGRVEVIVEDELGESRTVAQLGEGDFFGELALLEDAPRSATVKAINEVEVLLLDRPVFERFVERSGGAREKLSETVRALRLIQQMPLFEEFSAEEAASVATQFRMEQFDKDEEIVTYGEIGGKFYVIQSGTADVVVPENDSERTIGTLGSQDFFGEIGLLFDVPRTATVRATEPLTAFALNRTDFLELLGGNPFARQRLSRISEQRTRELQAVRSAASDA